MPFRIVRNDITRMHTDAIVNTASSWPEIGPGCDSAVYRAAGAEELLAYRKEHVGSVPEGEVFLTPGFRLPAKWIIHAVSPLFVGGSRGEEELLRSCYRRSLRLARDTGIRSIAFPLISTGSFGYPKEEGMRIAVDEIHAFLLSSDMEVFLVVFGEQESRMGRRLDPYLEAYIDRNYVERKYEEEYGSFCGSFPDSAPARPARVSRRRRRFSESFPDAFETGSARTESAPGGVPDDACAQEPAFPSGEILMEEALPDAAAPLSAPEPAGTLFSRLDAEDGAIEEMQRKLEERMAHRSDSFSEYLLYLIRKKGLQNADVYKKAILDKKVFSKIKNNPDYHPQKLTALCLCVGAELNLDETRDLLARAGYALSPWDKTDIIFSFFIENGIYDMIELDIQLEEHGLPCVIA